MDTAAKILVVGGVLNLALGLGLGFALAGARRRDPATPQALLLKAHELALLEGILLLALVVAFSFADLSRAAAVSAAYLFVAASVFQDASAFLNWRQGVGDQFVARSIGLRLASVNAGLATIATLLLAIGVFKAL